MSASTTAAIEQMFRDMLIVYDDGTPRTKHVTTNVIIDAGEGAGTATARSYVTVFQARPGLTLQAIMSGRYQDRFERRDGHWRFTERQVRVDLAGDLSGHLRQAAGAEADAGARERYHGPFEKKDSKNILF